MKWAAACIIPINCIFFCYHITILYQINLNCSSYLHYETVLVLMSASFFSHVLPFHHHPFLLVVDLTSFFLFFFVLLSRVFFTQLPYHVRVSHLLMSFLFLRYCPRSLPLACPPSSSSKQTTISGINFQMNFANRLIPSPYLYHLFSHTQPVHCVLHYHLRHKHLLSLPLHAENASLP